MVLNSTIIATGGPGPAVQGKSRRANIRSVSGRRHSVVLLALAQSLIVMSLLLEYRCVAINPCNDNIIGHNRR